MLKFSEFIKEDEEGIEYPNGVYIATKLSDITINNINEYRSLYFGNLELEAELHCTLIYSKKPFKGKIVNKSYTYRGTVESFELFGPEHDTLVAKVKSPEMEMRNAELIEEHDFASNYDEYKPHVTLAFKAQDTILYALPPMNFVFEFIMEYTEGLKEDIKTGAPTVSKTFVGVELDKAKGGEIIKAK